MGRELCLRKQPRSVISSSFNGLPLSRPNYGSTGSTALDEYKVLHIMLYILLL